MGKGVASGYVPPAEITVCDGCFHKDVCGDRDYLAENKCSARAGGCRCGECRFEEDCEKQVTIVRCDYVLGQNIYKYCRVEWCGAGEPREAQEHE